ncbi:hypothetical protein ABW19_dt0200341 [Dactylella cylindrospora]|nr:hypothetical protein ABW19_dt0200341 [Dactylella cylindrospora]
MQVPRLLLVVFAALFALVLAVPVDDQLEERNYNYGVRTIVKYKTKVQTKWATRTKWATTTKYLKTKTLIKTATKVVKSVSTKTVKSVSVSTRCTTKYSTLYSTKTATVTKTAVGYGYQTPVVSTKTVTIIGYIPGTTGTIVVTIPASTVTSVATVYVDVTAACPTPSTSSTTESTTAPTTTSSELTTTSSTTESTTSSELTTSSTTSESTTSSATTTEPTTSSTTESTTSSTTESTTSSTTESTTSSTTESTTSSTTESTTSTTESTTSSTTESTTSSTTTESTTSSTTSESTTSSTTTSESTTSSTTTTSTTTAPAEPTLDPGDGDWTPLGCYAEPPSNRILPAKQFTSDDDMTAGKCRELCGDAGYKYAGVEYGRECWCDNVLGANGGSETDEENCKGRLCTGSDDEYCGGDNFIWIFENTDSTPSGPVVHPGSHDYAYNHCKSEPSGGRALTSSQGGADMTPEKCFEICASPDTFDAASGTYGPFSYCALEYGQECWYGNELSADIDAAETSCDFTCAGDDGYICGGYGTFSLYKLTVGTIG